VLPVQVNTPDSRMGTILRKEAIPIEWRKKGAKIRGTAMVRVVPPKFRELDDRTPYDGVVQ